MRKVLGIPLLVVLGLIAGSCGHYDPDPIIAWVVPSQGSTLGGESVTISGFEFDDDFTVDLPEVFFGPQAALSVTAVSHDRVLAETPPNTAAGPVDVVLRTTRRKQEATSVGGFTYVIPPPVPLVLTVNPSAGEVAGGEMVTVTTLAFQDDFQVDLPEIFFGSSAALSISALSADSVLAETPPNPVTGPVDVTVQSTGIAETATLVDGYIYRPSPPFPYTAEIFGETISLPSDSVIYLLKRGGGMAWSGGTWTDRFGNVVTGSRLERAQDGVIASVNLLDPNVSFNVYTYACDRDSFDPGLVAATPANKAAAESYILSKFPAGGSGTGPALREALMEKNNLTVMLVTDGQPNCGAAGTAGHKQMALLENTQLAEIHTFGIADFGIFADFLMELAQETGGIYIHME